MLEQLKKEVYEANMELQEKGLVIYTWGNVSGIDRENNLVVIKPSGVEYDELSPEDMVVVDFDQNEDIVHLPIRRRISNFTKPLIILVAWYIHILHGPLRLLRQVWQFRHWERHMRIIFTEIFRAQEI